MGARPVLLVSVYMFLVFFNPSAPFIVQMMTDHLALKPAALVEHVFPLFTYSLAVLLLLFGIPAEALRYRVFLVLGPLLAVGAKLALILGTAWPLPGAQTSEILIAGTWACNTVYSAYLFAAVGKDQYQRAASYSRAAALAATTLSAGLGQLLYAHVPLTALFWASLVVQCVACVWALVALPAARTDGDLGRLGGLQYLRRVGRQLWVSYQNPALLRWGLWSAISVAIHFLALTFFQSLTKAINADTNWNGWISVVASLAGAGAALLSGTARVDRMLQSSRHVPVLCALVPAVAAGCLVWLSWATSLAAAFAAFVLYQVAFEFMTPVVNVQVARSLSFERFSGVFGINNSLGIVIQLVVQLCAGEHVMSLTVRWQYRLYAALLCVLAIVYGVVYVVLLCGPHADPEEGNRRYGTAKDGRPYEAVLHKPLPHHHHNHHHHVQRPEGFDGDDDGAIVLDLDMMGARAPSSSRDHPDAMYEGGPMSSQS